MGYGPRSGRGLGTCPAGFGWGTGFGRRFAGMPRITKKEESEMLSEEAELLEEELKEIKDRLAELKGRK